MGTVRNDGVSSRPSFLGAIGGSIVNRFGYGRVYNQLEVGDVATEQKIANFSNLGDWPLDSVDMLSANAGMGYYFSNFNDVPYYYLVPLDPAAGGNSRGAPFRLSDSRLMNGTRRVTALGANRFALSGRRYTYIISVPPPAK